MKKFNLHNTKNVLSFFAVRNCKQNAKQIHVYECLPENENHNVWCKVLMCTCTCLLKGTYTCERDFFHDKV